MSRLRNLSSQNDVRLGDEEEEKEGPTNDEITSLDPELLAICPFPYNGVDPASTTLDILDSALDDP